MVAFLEKIGVVGRTDQSVRDIEKLMVYSGLNVAIITVLSLGFHRCVKSAIPPVTYVAISTGTLALRFLLSVL